MEYTKEISRKRKEEKKRPANRQPSERNKEHTNERKVEKKEKYTPALAVYIVYKASEYFKVSLFAKNLCAYIALNQNVCIQHRTRRVVQLSDSPQHTTTTTTKNASRVL